jgi:hypothetical protein
VTCTVSGEHYQWLKNVLIAANDEMNNNEMSSTLRHIFVQAHVPVLQPVRKINCSGQYLDQGTDSKFWNLMRKYNVDVYFAGEVHANTATKDPKSKLIQVVSRANRFNNFLRVNVTDNGFSIMSYNEVGDKWRWNANYTQHGLLTVDKSASKKQTIIKSSGSLELVKPKLPLIQFNFEKEDKNPLESRIVLGMKYDQYQQMLGGYSKKIRGQKSFSGLINHGSFGRKFSVFFVQIQNTIPLFFVHFIECHFVVLTSLGYLV